MSRFHRALTGLFSGLAMILLLLALAAAPGQVSLADGGGGTAGTICDNTCTNSFPLCSSGTCATVPQDCTRYSCREILKRMCECNTGPVP